MDTADRDGEVGERRREGKWGKGMNDRIGIAGCRSGTGSAAATVT